ncbi:site-specific integrase [Mucilaginibacter terrigena]|uniref:Site-specific integrase n=1 Tax=Mucilaginibacter terrigena TaxID=2492395 RepID=A0A4Q5LPL7_9SPHI|nr:site-specific integrase [Mucilaginibacter terrigena]RYU91356.1 site-specific integrase [Mucilaginibacter terrigena]
MTKSFALLFQMKRTKALPNGNAPIYLRITIDSERVEIATKRNAPPDKWNTIAQKVMGNTDEAKSVNNHLKTVEQKAYEVYREMIERNIPITAQTFKDRMNGIEEEVVCRMLIPIFEDHNRQVEALIGKEYAPATAIRYQTTIKHVKNFLKWKYKVSDINIQDLDHEFVTSLEFYLRTVRHCNNNSAVKYIKNLKKIIHICVANNWLVRSPFINYKTKIKEVIRDFLSSDELDSISEKRFVSERLNQVRDVFLFSCYTGLAYADVNKLKRSEISTGIDSQKWIFTTRQKTETASRIPLLPVALDLLKKYEDYPACINEGKLLPVLSNQKMNAYLKEIADVCGIEKELTFHIARHTFATTVTLANGVSIESVSKMLGHKNIRTTQHYAKILDSTVSRDMDMLRGKMEAKKSAVLKKVTNQ